MTIPTFSDDELRRAFARLQDRWKEWGTPTPLTFEQYCSAPLLFAALRAEAMTERSRAAPRSVNDQHGITRSMHRAYSFRGPQTGLDNKMRAAGEKEERED